MKSKTIALIISLMLISPYCLAGSKSDELFVVPPSDWKPSWLVSSVGGKVTVDWPAIERCAAHQPSDKDWSGEWGTVFDCKLMLDARKATLQEMDK